MDHPPLSYAQLRATAKFYNAHSGNVADAAHAANKPYSTFRANVKMVRNKYPKWLKDFAPVVKGNAPLSDDKAKQAWQAFQAADNNSIKAAEALGLRRTTFQSRLRTYTTKHGIDLAKLREAAPPKPKTIDDHVTEHREKQTETASRAKLKDAARIIGDLQDRIEQLEWAAKASLEPAEWTLPTRKRESAEHQPYILTSDFQIGEVIKADETEAGYGYDSDIFVRRYRHMIDTIIYLSFEHAGQSWKYPGIIYARGGDTISGAIHDELKETDDLTPIEAVELSFEEEAAGIKKLADAFGRVDVKTPGSAGNHDRNLLKPTTKNASGHSYDRLIAYMLRREFNTDSRVTFQTSKSFDVRFPIYDKTILLTHGDRMGSKGGQGFVGPAATIMRGVQKVVMEQAALGFHIDRVDHGHFHYPMYLDWVLSNGCMPGYSEYAKQFRMRPQPPQQFLLYHHHKRGVVDIKPIILGDSMKYQARAAAFAVCAACSVALYLTGHGEAAGWWSAGAIVMLICLL